MLGTRAARICAALVLALLAGLGAPPAPAAGASGAGGVAIRPAAPGQVWLRVTGLRGGQVNARFVVLNPTLVRQRVALYAVDGRLDRASGAFTLADEGAPREDVGAWARLPARRLALAPGEQRTLTLTLAVPPDAAPGQHVGGIVIQGRGRPAPAPGGSGEQILVVTRLGLRVYVRVPADAAAGARLSSLRITRAGWSTPLPLRLVGVRRGPRVAVAARLSNPGGRAQPRLRARLEILRGSRRVARTGWLTLPPLAAHASRPLALTATVHGGSSGGYRARLEVSGAGSEVHHEGRVPFGARGLDPLGLVGLALVAAAVALALRARARAGAAPR